MTQLDKYKSDIDALLDRGLKLRLAIRYETVPEEMGPQGLSAEEIAKLPTLDDDYQKWYSEALSCLKQLLPDRVADFVSYYKPDKARRDIRHSNYTMTDYLRGTTITRSYGDTIVSPSAAIHVLDQQVQIVAAMRRRFESSLFDIHARRSLPTT